VQLGMTNKSLERSVQKFYKKLIFHVTSPKVAFCELHVKNYGSKFHHCNYHTNLSSIVGRSIMIYEDFN
jgi:hypothetical protein